MTLRQAAHGVARLWFAGVFYRRTLVGRRPRGLEFSPEALWPGDSKRGTAIVRGEFRFAGQVEREPDALWRPKAVSPDWIAELHGFGWLCDLNAFGGEAARARARELTAKWIAGESRWRPLTWRPDVVASRVANWLTYADFMFPTAEVTPPDAWFDSLARQARHLRRLAVLLDSGVDRLILIKALIYACLCLPGEGQRLSRWTAALADEIAFQVAADGGHISRSPAVHFAVLRHFIDLRSALRGARTEVPEALQSAIDRMAPMLRFFRHGDGGLCLFNDTNEGENWLIDVALTQAESRGKPLDAAPHSGFQRLAANRTLLIVDTGAVAPPGFDEHAHAGALGFEMSVGRQRLIVNCGAYAGQRNEWKTAQRATAAHSTLTVDDFNSAEILSADMIGKRPRGVASKRRTMDGNIWVDAELDGYAGLVGLVHRRRLYLSATGGDLRGEDSLIGGVGRKFVVRFHLHPTVRASLVQDGTAVLLRLADGSGWRVRADGGILGVQESVYLGVRGETRRSEQIVVSGVTQADGARIKWALTRLSDDS